MGRSRSRSRDRGDRDRRRSRERRRSSSRDRYRRREQSDSRDKRRMDRSRSRDRHRRRSSSRDRYRDRRERSSSRDRHRNSKRSRSRSREWPSSRPDSASASASGASTAAEDAEAKRRRLEAWKAKKEAAVQQQQAQLQGQQQGSEQQAQPQAAGAKSEPAAGGDAWMPWDDPTTAAAPAAAPANDEAAADGGGDAAWMPWDQPDAAAAAPAAEPPAAPAAAGAGGVGEAAEQPGSEGYSMPAAVAARKAKADAEKARAMLQQAADDDVDPLEAFMAAEVLPEVAAREQEERRKQEEERIALAKAIAEGKAKLPQAEDISDEEEETPDVEIQVPTNKVKLIVGPGGSKIQEIQKKSKARVQIKKSEEELYRAFGAGSTQVLNAAQKRAAAKEARKKGQRPPEQLGVDEPEEGKEPEKKLTTIMIFGDAKAVEIAMRMIDEAVANKEQKAKQREKEYERKREQKRRERQLYHLRHALDYEALDLPMGASKLDIKKAYRQLVLKWHPDKHPHDRDAATERFQAIQKAYDSLMSTSEDDKVEQLAAA